MNDRHNFPWMLTAALTVALVFVLSRSSDFRRSSSPDAAWEVRTLEDAEQLIAGLHDELAAERQKREQLFEEVSLLKRLLMQ